ncbi:acyloxyacyl hydrolase [Echinicola strongylocentroti]|uniref:Acyloxyacyl hydrolase n=1 Tax=Echinicola strongylocentroti TaxID=1795355 RepID=A0A2Z4IE17_9BACT|nr:acyloxyacyl hydrolase [Echinicola strongylocentroti]AWW29090.1 acyloxyacyl hydrolase [Echinicola strongylocentroti]
MKKRKVWIFWSVCLPLFFLCFPVFSQDDPEVDSVSDLTAKKYLHGIETEMRYAYVFPPKPFYRNQESSSRLSRSVFSAHLRYGFYLPEGTNRYRVYGDTYWGIGMAQFYFGNKKELGNPLALYLYQGARIANLSQKITLNFEWNFGISGGWEPYDVESNPNNKTVGSRFNAYINTGLLLKWKPSDRLYFTLGTDLTHFSNGNTVYPNAGVNMLGGKLGAVYRLGEVDRHQYPKSKQFSSDLMFSQHVSYDVVLFGSWRRKGVAYNGERVPSPDSYPVIGANISTLYNFSHKFRAGLSLDPLYDGSANVYTEDFIIGTEQPFITPDLKYQLALGVSARAEFVMPVFSVGVGLGTNVLHRGGDFKGTYQVFLLKTRVSKSAFIHIGYNLKDFSQANFLMLGMGYTFGNKRMY